MANMVVKRGLCCIVDTRDKIVISSSWKESVIKVSFAEMCTN